MCKRTRVGHPIYDLLPTEIEGSIPWRNSSWDMRWSWNHATDAVWRQLDPELLGITHNHWVVLQTVSHDPSSGCWPILFFRKMWMAWSKSVGRRRTPFPSAAYFSMEFMLSEALRIYSGGLGNVAGDQLEAASDLGVPVVTVRTLTAGSVSPVSVRATCHPSELRRNEKGKTARMLCAWVSPNK